MVDELQTLMEDANNAPHLAWVTERKRWALYMDKLMSTPRPILVPGGAYTEEQHQSLVDMFPQLAYHQHLPRMRELDDDGLDHLSMIHKTAFELFREGMKVVVTPDSKLDIQWFTREDADILLPIHTPKEILIFFAKRYYAVLNEDEGKTSSFTLSRFCNRTKWNHNSEFLVTVTSNRPLKKSLLISFCKRFGCPLTAFAEGDYVDDVTLGGISMKEPKRSRNGQTLAAMSTLLLASAMSNRRRF